MGFRMIIPLIISGLIVYTAIKSINGNSKSSKEPVDRANSALLILNKKYASSEISEEGYLRKKALLKY